MFCCSWIAGEAYNIFWGLYWGKARMIIWKRLAYYRNWQNLVIISLNYTFEYVIPELFDYLKSTDLDLIKYTYLYLDKLSIKINYILFKDTSKMWWRWMLMLYYLLPKYTSNDTGGA